MMDSMACSKLTVVSWFIGVSPFHGQKIPADKGMVPGFDDPFHS